MKKSVLFMVTILAASLLSGCVTAGLKAIDANWGAQNQIILNKIGVRTYDNISKEKAMNAMLAAFQRLDLIVDNADFKLGFLKASANAPKPLTYEEFEKVKNIEDGGVKSRCPFFDWENMRDFTSEFSVVFLETGNGVQISIRANLHFIGSRAMVIPITEFPSEGLKIGIPKIWNEFEKIAFIQEKTLNK